jgi:hypothetical protein
MSHVRSQILQTVAGVMELVTPGKVFGSVHPITPDTMPGISLYWVSNAANTATVIGGTERPMRMMTDIYVDGIDGDEAADEIARQIELQLFADETVGGVAIGVLDAGSRIEHDDSTAVAHTVLRQAWDIIYRTIDGDPEHGM